MARQRDEVKQAAILEAAAIVIAEQGLSAPTAKISKVAGVADGTLFVYFPTKADLFNKLYLALKEELIAAMMASFPVKKNLKDQLFHVWKVKTTWGVAQPAKRKTLAQLAVSDLVTDNSRRVGIERATEVVTLLAKVCAHGSLQSTPETFVWALFEAMAATTTDFMTNEPKRAEFYCTTAFKSLWATLTAEAD
jgi:AcrR family transcriptional regulator